MATGPWHYAEAERLITAAADPYDVDLTQAERNTMALGALVHATLALAAATALGHLTEGGPLAADRKAWIATASEHPRLQERIREANDEEAMA